MSHFHVRYRIRYRDLYLADNLVDWVADKSKSAQLMPELVDAIADDCDFQPVCIERDYRLEWQKRNQPKAQPKPQPKPYLKPCGTLAADRQLENYGIPAYAKALTDEQMRDVPY